MGAQQSTPSSTANKTEKDFTETPVTGGILSAIQSCTAATSPDFDSSSQSLQNTHQRPTPSSMRVHNSLSTFPIASFPPELTNISIKITDKQMHKLDLIHLIIFGISVRPSPSDVSLNSVAPPASAFFRQFLFCQLQTFRNFLSKPGAEPSVQLTECLNLFTAILVKNLNSPRLSLIFEETMDSVSLGEMLLIYLVNSIDLVAANDTGNSERQARNILKGLLVTTALMLTWTRINCSDGGNRRYFWCLLKDLNESTKMIFLKSTLRLISDGSNESSKQGSPFLLPSWISGSSDSLIDHRRAALLFLTAFLDDDDNQSTTQQSNSERISFRKVLGGFSESKALFDGLFKFLVSNLSLPRKNSSELMLPVLLLALMIEHCPAFKRFLLSKLDLDELIIPLCKISYMLVTGQVPISRQSWRSLVYWSLGVLLMLSEDEVLRKQIFQMTFDHGVKWLPVEEVIDVPESVGDFVLRVVLMVIKVNLEDEGDTGRDEFLNELLISLMTNLMESIVSVDRVNCDLIFDEIIISLQGNGLISIAKLILIAVGNVLLNHPKSNALLVYRIDEGFDNLMKIFESNNDCSKGPVVRVYTRLHGFLSQRSIHANNLVNTHSPTEIITMYNTILQNYPTVSVRRDFRGARKPAGVRCLLKSKGRIEGESGAVDIWAMVYSSIPWSDYL